VKAKEINGTQPNVSNREKSELNTFTAINFCQKIASIRTSGSNVNFENFLGLDETVNK
jgi:hypothetical protein